MTRGIILSLGLTLLLPLAGCDTPGDDTPPPTTITAETPNAFLRYVNTQAALGAGDYEIVAATATAGQHGYFRIMVTRDDGTTEELVGQWSNSGGQDPEAAGNVRYDLALERAGGIRIAMDSAVDGYLYLVRNGNVIASDDNSGEGTNPLIDLANSRISSVEYAQAYYRAVDPDSERTTLQDYLRKTCFVAGNPDCVGETLGAQHHVVFRDSKDLGYGRNMYARKNSDGTIAFYVDNYVVRLQRGSSSNYGPINVEAAVREDRDYHLGTNAIEFSPIDPDDPGSDKIAKFFTYSPSGERLTSADLDGRGVKHMPQMCWVCHGGRLFPLDSNGDFPLVSLRSAKYNQLEVDSFEYSSLPGWSRADQEAGFRGMNRFVYDSYIEMQGRDIDQMGRWHADFAAELAASRYGGPTFPESTYQTGEVPEGWQPDIDRPEGVDQLYTRVVEPHCVACHSLQGNSAGEDYSGQPLAAAVNFSSWEKFISYREQIIDYVYRRGQMPLSLRNWEDFWRNPDDKAALLAYFLDDPSLFDAQGKVVRPGQPVARPGADRTVTSPVQLDGTASNFAAGYYWSVVDAPLGATVTFDDASAARPVLTADLDGDYEISLLVINPLGSSEETFTVTIDSAAADQDELTFVDDIMPLLGSTTGLECSSCHNETEATSTYHGLPVYWYLPDNDNLYQDVRARVNLADPENSQLVIKPTGQRHGGGIQINLDSPAGRADYNTLLNWIRAGAPCGSGPVCD